MDMKVWPLFHNGVAAGLRIAQGISKVYEGSDESLAYSTASSL